MSTAPRPQMQPSCTSPENGSTSSPCCSRRVPRRGGRGSAAATGSCPRLRAVRHHGRASWLWLVAARSRFPTSSSSFPATYSAASRSPAPLPSPKLDVRCESGHGRARPPRLRSGEVARIRGSVTRSIPPVCGAVRQVRELVSFARPAGAAARPCPGGGIGRRASLRC